MPENILLNKSEMSLIQDRLAAQILEKHSDPQNLLLVGILRRGADLTVRLAKILEKNLGAKIDYGTIDINLYRDDWTTRSGGTPHVGSSAMPFTIDHKNVILVDDVLFSGRTVRSALEALLDYGRPQKVELLVFIDRGHRELPICPDYVGRKITTEKAHHIDVLFEERDGREMVCLS